jgi:hypothetical protein
VVIPILHPNVSKEMARFFGVRYVSQYFLIDPKIAGFRAVALNCIRTIIRLLSLMVHEEIDPRYELEPSDRYAGDVERWQLNLSTDDFKRGALPTWSYSLEIIYTRAFVFSFVAVRCGTSPS